MATHHTSVEELPIPAANWEATLQQYTADLKQNPEFPDSDTAVFHLPDHELHLLRFDDEQLRSGAEPGVIHNPNF